MEYIVPPIYFYLISIAETLGVFATLVSVFSFIGLALITLFTIGTYSEEDKEEIRPYKTGLIVAFCISLPLALLIPSKETAEKMMIAKYLTVENVEKGKEEAKELIDYIFEKVEGNEEE